MELSLSSDGERGILLKRQRRNLLATVLDDATEETLLVGVVAFGVRYFDGEAWQEEWDSAEYGDSLPVALEVTLELDQRSLRDPEQNYRVIQIIPLPGANLDAINAALTGET